MILPSVALDQDVVAPEIDPSDEPSSCVTDLQLTLRSGQTGSAQHVHKSGFEVALGRWGSVRTAGQHGSQYLTSAARIGRPGRRRDVVERQEASSQRALERQFDEVFGVDRSAVTTPTAQRREVLAQPGKDRCD